MTADKSLRRGAGVMPSPGGDATTPAEVEVAARAVAVAAGDGCFERIDQNDCGCDGDCLDHEDAAYYRTLAAAALVAAGVVSDAAAEVDTRVSRGPFRPTCHACGPGYRIGDEGCRHVAPVRVSGVAASKADTGWDYVPWNGVHEFRPWTVIHDHHGKPWLAPGCSCGTIRSGGSPDESEASMRAWHVDHLTHVAASRADTDEAGA